MGADAFSTSTCPTAGSIPRRTHYSMRTTYNDREGRAEVRTKATTKEEVKADKESAETEETAEDPVEEIKDDKTTSEEEKD